MTDVAELAKHRSKQITFNTAHEHEVQSTVWFVPVEIFHWQSLRVPLFSKDPEDVETKLRGSVLLITGGSSSSFRIVNFHEKKWLD